MKGKCTRSVHAARTLVCDINIFYFLFFISVLFDFGVETSCDCVLTPKKVAVFHLQRIAGGCVQWLRVICLTVQSVLTTSSNFALMPTCNPPTWTLTQRKCTREKRASLVCVGRMSRGIAYATKSLSGEKVTCDAFLHKCSGLVLSMLLTRRKDIAKNDSISSIVELMIIKFVI